MRVLVCGGRDFTSYFYMCKELDKILFPVNKNAIQHQAYFNPNHTIISGGAKGADSLAKRYADEAEQNFLEFPADWKKYGKSAGFIRNKQMLDEGKPDLVIAFPGGKGTKMMIELAKKAGIPVKEFSYGETS